MDVFIFLTYASCQLHEHTRQVRIFYYGLFAIIMSPVTINVNDGNSDKKSTGLLISPQPDQEGKKIQRPNYNFCKPLKKKKIRICPSNQDSAAAMTASDEKWRPFNCFFSRVQLRTYQHPCNNTYMYLSIHVKWQLFLTVLTKFTVIDKFEYNCQHKFS